MKEDKPEVKPEKKERFELVKVATEFGMGFQDNLTDEVIDSNTLLLRLANDIHAIKKAVA